MFPVFSHPPDLVSLRIKTNCPHWVSRLYSSYSCPRALEAEAGKLDINLKAVITTGRVPRGALQNTCVFHALLLKITVTVTLSSVSSATTRTASQKAIRLPVLSSLHYRKAFGASRASGILSTIWTLDSKVRYSQLQPLLFLSVWFHVNASQWLLDWPHQYRRWALMCARLSPEMWLLTGLTISRTRRLVQWDMGQGPFNCLFLLVHLF